MQPPLRFLLFLFFLPLFLVGQSGYHIDYFTTDNGLPSNGIKGLQWDTTTGFLWIATEAGIVRYNGLSLKTFTPGDEPHISNERILSLSKTSDGRITTVDNTGNVFDVYKNKLRFRLKQNPEEANGRLLPFITVSDKLYQNKVHFPEGQILLQFVTFFPVSDTAAFFIYNNKLWYHSLSLRRPAAQSYAFNHWSGGFKIDDKFFLFDSAHRVFRYVSPTTLVPTQIIEAGTNKVLEYTRLLWTNGMKKPLLFDKEKAWELAYETGSIVARLVCDALPNDVLIRYAQYNEQKKVLVIGTDSKGIAVISKNRVATLKRKEFTRGQRTSYYAQVELPGGNVLTNEGHVIGPQHRKLGGLPVKDVFSLSVYNDGDSVLYYAKFMTSLGYDCLYRYRYKTGETKIFSRIRFGDQCLLQRTDGNLYAVTNQGIGRLEGDSLHFVYLFDTKRPLGGLYDVKEIEPGVLAVVGCRALLRYTVATGAIDTLFSPGSHCVRTVWKYKDYLFFGTYGAGLYTYRNGKVKPLPLDKNKYLLYTHCFVKDDEENCWISTNKGLFKVPLAQLTEAVDKQASQLYYHYFGKQDGMQMTELNGGCKPCALVMKDGTISFPSMDGLLWVNPKTAGLALPEGEIFVDAVLADSVRFDASSLDKKKIPFGTSELVFRFAFPAWCNRENIYLEYKLTDREGWKPVRLDNEIELRFGNLPEGNYTLQLRKLDGFGLNNYTYKILRFTVATPWHRSLWFYLAASLLFMALIVALFRWRIRHLTYKQRRLQQLVDEKTRELQKKNEVLEKADSVKTRLISIISHDIVTPLKFLTATSRNLVEKRSAMDDDLQQETLEEMMLTSQELQQLSTNILNWIKYQNESRRLVKETFSLHRLVADVLRVFSGVAREKGLLLVNAVDENLSVQQYLEPLKIVVHNLLSNAINFSEKGIITVGGNATPQIVTITVRDEGKGMSEEQIQNVMGAEYIVSSANVDNKKGNGLGYLIVKDLLKMLNGSLKIESKKGSGTAIFITLPSGSVGF